MKTREDFILAAAKKFLSKLVPAKDLEAALLGYSLSRSDAGFTEAILQGSKEYDKYQDEQNKTRQPSIQYLMYECTFDGDGMDIYTRTEAWLWKYTNGSVMRDGFWSDTNQTGLQLHLDKNKTLEEQLGILEFIPHIKPDKDGYRRVGLLEPTLSEGGIYKIRIDAEGKPALTKTVYGQTRTVKQWDTLQECLAYLYQHHSNDY